MGLKALAALVLFFAADEDESFDGRTRGKRERDAFAAVKPLRRKATNDPTTAQFEKNC